MTGPAIRRVVLTGAECTGKTTLAADLAAHYETAWSPEFARAYAAAKGRALDHTDVETIARGQVASEDEAAARARGGLLILDTDLVSTVVYSRHYYGACPEWIARLAGQRLADLYLLHHPDTPWIPDPGVRDAAGARDEIHALFRHTLDALGARVVDVRGSWDARRAAALAAIDAQLALVRVRRFGGREPPAS